MNFLRIIGGILLTALIVTFAIVRIAFEIIGLSTAPEDFAQLKQRMPDVMRWLFTTPWPVPTLLVLLAAGLAAWLLWTGARFTATEAVAEGPAFDEDRIRRIVQEEILQAPIITTGEKYPPDPPPPAPSIRLTTAERERLSERLINLDDFLATDLARELEPFRDLLGWSEFLRFNGAEALHAKIEALRPGLRDRILALGRTLVGFDEQTTILKLNASYIKTRMLPIEDALMHMSSVTEIMEPESINYAPLRMPGAHYAKVVAEVDEEAARVRREIALWRKRIAEGELD